MELRYKPWLELAHYRFAETRHYELRTRFRAQLQQGLRRLVPGMHRKGECSPVHEQEGAAAEQGQCLKRVLRSEVDIAPGRMEPAHLQWTAARQQPAMCQTLADDSSHRSLRGDILPGE